MRTKLLAYSEPTSKWDVRTLQEPDCVLAISIIAFPMDEEDEVVVPVPPPGPPPPLPAAAAAVSPLTVPGCGAVPGGGAAPPPTGGESPCSVFSPADQNDWAGSDKDRGTPRWGEARA